MIGSCSSAPARGGAGAQGKAPVAGEFDKEGAVTALADAAAAAKECRQPGGPTGSTRVRVVFAPSGVITSVRVQDPPFEGTAVGDCIAAWFAKARIPPFEARPIAVTKSVRIE